MINTTPVVTANYRKKLILPILVVALGLATTIAILLLTKPPLVESIKAETQRMTAAGKAYGAKEISFSRYPGVMNVSIDGKSLQCGKLTDEEFAAKKPIECGGGIVLKAK